jgi:poly(3-hydroxybutyrate) depolymerase
MGDFDIADQIAACAVRDYHIDPHRIYTTGCSAGGLQAGCMGLMRSNYIAAVLPNSGGSVFAQASQSPDHVPSVMTMHGAPGSDVVIVDFSQTSMTYDQAIKSAGGFVVNCNHGGGHCGAPADLQKAGWQFLKDHPFGVSTEPYAGGLPAGFPSYCMIF